MRQSRSSHLVVLLGIALLAPGCSLPGSSRNARLQDEDPSVRVTAAIEAGQAKDAQAVPLLVDRLGDSDADVRFFAIAALEKITGQTMGYKVYEAPALRQQAIERWRQWLAKQPAGKQGTPS